MSAVSQYLSVLVLVLVLGRGRRRRPASSSVISIISISSKKTLCSAVTRSVSVLLSFIQTSTTSTSTLHFYTRRQGFFRPGTIRTKDPLSLLRTDTATAGIAPLHLALTSPAAADRLGPTSSLHYSYNCRSSFSPLHSLSLASGLFPCSRLLVVYGTTRRSAPLISLIAPGFTFPSRTQHLTSPIHRPTPQLQRLTCTHGEPYTPRSRTASSNRGLGATRRHGRQHRYRTAGDSPTQAAITPHTLQGYILRTSLSRTHRCPLLYFTALSTCTAASKSAPSLCKFLALPLHSTFVDDRNNPTLPPISSSSFSFTFTT